jgi:hypothetical protein
MNNGKYNTEEYKRKQSEKTDRLFGPITNHEKTCMCCGNKFIFVGRLKTKKYEKSVFCSRSCSNNRTKWWDKNLSNYRTIAFKNWDKKCVVCGFDKIVAVHHIDENKQNNNPQNLIPLCPNHHEMVHSKWSGEVIPIIEKIIKEKYGDIV